MRTSGRWLLIMLALNVLSAISLAAGPTETASLKGITGVNVLVESLSEHASRLGIRRESLQTVVELRLRRSGIPVLSEEQSMATPAGAYLYVNVNVLPTAAAINVSLHQNVRLVNGALYAIAMTWDSAELISGTDLAKRVRDSLEEKVDEFCNDFLKANPKK